MTVVDGLIPRAEKTLVAKSHYQHQTKRGATDRPKHQAEKQLTEMRMSGLFDLNPFHGSALEPEPIQPILRAKRGEKANHDDKKNKSCISQD